MATRTQCLSVCENGKHFVCIRCNDGSVNPYKLYHKWYDRGWHKKKVVEYGDFESVLYYLIQNVK